MATGGRQESLWRGRHSRGHAGRASPSHVTEAGRGGGGPDHRSPQVHRPKKLSSLPLLGSGGLHHRDTTEEVIGHDRVLTSGLSPLLKAVGSWRSLRLRAGSPAVSPLPWVFSQSFPVNITSSSTERGLAVDINGGLYVPLSTALEVSGLGRKAAALTR